MESKHIIVNVGRQLGAGGHDIGMMLAEDFNARYYDKEILNLAAQESGFSKEFFEQNDERHGFLHSLSLARLTHLTDNSFYQSNFSQESLFKFQSDAIRKAASEGSCVFVGRCADYVLRDFQNVVNVFVTAPLSFRIENIVNTTIDVELPQLRKLDVGNIRKIKSLLAILASNVPYTVDTVKLSTMAEMSRTTLLQYLQYLSEAQLINLLYSDLVNVKRLQKPDKIYLENPNLLHALSTTTVNEGAMREAFLINQLSGHHLVEYSKTSADFTIDRQYTIEVGGHSKDGKQIAGQPNSYIATADEEYVLGNKIPLWLFGFLY